MIVAPLDDTIIDEVIEWREYEERQRAKPR